MKIVAAVFADFRETFLGGPSQLGAGLGSRTVLGHLLARLARVEGVDARCLVVRPQDAGAAAAAVGDGAVAAAGVELAAIDDVPRPRRRLIRSARKWNLDSWRGGPLGVTWFDEFVEAGAVARVLNQYQADAVLCLEGHQAALDPSIATRMVAHQRANAAEASFVFSQAPPGIAGVVVCREIVAELLEQQWPFGLLLAYRPEFPRADLITRPMACPVPAIVGQTAARFTGDTRRSREILSAAFAELGEDVNAAGLCEWMRSTMHTRAAPLPVEIEIELTTDDPLPGTTLRPRGDRVPRRGPADLDAIRRLADELARYDDRLVVLGGHGDPLLHPRFGEVCRAIRSAGVCGLAVVTPLVELLPENLDTLLDAQVDLVEVQLDANTRETYAALQGADAFDAVLANIERIEAARRERESAQPIVMPSLTRCGATIGEMEAFFDRWIQATGWALVRGDHDYGGQLRRPHMDNPPVLGAAPVVRGACRRLGSRVALLADGSVAQCGQDFRGIGVLGRWLDRPMADVWDDPAIASLREDHSRLDLRRRPLCAACDEWFRP